MNVSARFAISLHILTLLAVVVAEALANAR